MGWLTLSLHVLDSSSPHTWLAAVYGFVSQAVLLVHICLHTPCLVSLCAVLAKEAGVASTLIADQGPVSRLFCMCRLPGGITHNCNSAILQVAAGPGMQRVNVAIHSRRTLLDATLVQ